MTLVADWKLTAFTLLGFSYHTLNMLLAILRLSTFREGDSIDDTSITWIKFVATWKSLLQRNSTSRVALAQDLIEQGTICHWRRQPSTATYPSSSLHQACNTGWRVRSLSRRWSSCRDLRSKAIR